MADRLKMLEMLSSATRKQGIYKPRHLEQPET